MIHARLAPAAGAGPLTPTSRRPLPDADVHAVDTSDGVRLRLTRHRGGDRGPVVLVHGLGVSSRIFSLDTIDTNLTDYLCGHGFDVWLFDWRVSSDLPAATRQWTGDDAAMHDFPAALAKVRAVTGAAKVDMLVHCYGATTFFMAMLAGLEGVRSVVCSQVATHITAAPLLRLKTGLRLATAVKAVGFDTMTARVSDDPGLGERLYDTALRAYPIAPAERCDSAACRRITFLYGPLYRHDQLNQATHDALPELFGPANLTTFIHLARIFRRGQVVAVDGRDDYMGHLDRLAIPITFIHGALNACYLPRSTADTVAALEAVNGTGLYERHLVPGYGHIDCIFGKNAAADVYPLVLRHFERI